MSFFLGKESMTKFKFYITLQITIKHGNGNTQSRIYKAISESKFIAINISLTPSVDKKSLATWAAGIKHYF
jgi:hypothetical protein